MLTDLQLRKLADCEQSMANSYSHQDPLSLKNKAKHIMSAQALQALIHIRRQARKACDAAIKAKRQFNYLEF